MIWFVAGLTAWVLVLLLSWVLMDRSLISRILAMTDSHETSDKHAEKDGTVHPEKQDD